jgi:putative flavoprotein involved in K+ transport
METIDTIIIGAGQAGLAMSHRLTEQARTHVVLERGQLAERWRSQRWDSLHLLTPNWMTRLPGYRYRGPDPHGYLSAGGVVDYLDGYARSFDAPIVEVAPVDAVEAIDGGYRVVSGTHVWKAANVVVATGWCDEPFVPAAADGLDSAVHQLTPTSYRNPGELPDGGVLVVGASASGVQLADEIRRSGRNVVVAVGRHSRLPRRYRGMDIWWWLDRLGVLDKAIDEMPDPVAARREPSLQLVGRPDGGNLDLGTLRGSGAVLTGRVTAIDGLRVSFADDLEPTMAAADTRMRRVLAAIDRHIDATGLTSEVLVADTVAPIASGASPASLDLRAAGIAAVLWATGFRRDYSWLRVSVLDESGEIRQRQGVTAAPGLYALGLRFQHRRNSSFLDGVGRDAETIADHIASRDRWPARAAL